MYRILIVHNYETPYRHKLFTELSKNVGLTVVYLQSKDADNRLWSIEAARSYKSYRVKSYQFEKLAFNKFSELQNAIGYEKHDVILLSDNLPNFFSNMFLSLTIRNAKKLLWSEDVATNPCYPRIKSHFLNAAQLFFKYNVDGIVAFTEAAVESWKKRINPKMVFYCPQSSTRSKELNFYVTHKNSEELGLLFVGSFTGRKNEEVLCQVVNELAKDYDIRLTLIGEGPLRRQLTDQYGSLALSFLGWVDHSKLCEYYKTHHFLILPSKYDPWGMVVNEAMSCGTPCIVSGCVGAKELVRDSGFIIMPFDKDKAKEALLQAYRLGGDDYYALRRKAFGYAKDYTIEKSAECLLKIVEYVVNSMS